MCEEEIKLKSIRRQILDNHDHVSAKKDYLVWCEQKQDEIDSFNRKPVRINLSDIKQLFIDGNLQGNLYDVFRAHNYLYYGIPYYLLTKSCGNINDVQNIIAGQIDLTRINPQLVEKENKKTTKSDFEKIENEIAIIEKEDDKKKKIYNVLKIDQEEDYHTLKINYCTESIKENQEYTVHFPLLLSCKNIEKSGVPGKETSFNIDILINKGDNTYLGLSSGLKQVYETHETIKKIKLQIADINLNIKDKKFNRSELCNEINLFLSYLNSISKGFMYVEYNEERLSVLESIEIKSKKPEVVLNEGEKNKPYNTKAYNVFHQVYEYYDQENQICSSFFATNFIPMFLTGEYIYINYKLCALKIIEVLRGKMSVNACDFLIKNLEKDIQLEDSLIKKLKYRIKDLPYRHSDFTKEIYIVLNEEINNGKNTHEKLLHILTLVEEILNEYDKEFLPKTISDPPIIHGPETGVSKNKNEILKDIIDLIIINRASIDDIDTVIEKNLFPVFILASKYLDFKRPDETSVASYTAVNLTTKYVDEVSNAEYADYCKTSRANLNRYTADPRKMCRAFIDALNAEERLFLLNYIDTHPELHYDLLKELEVKWEGFLNMLMTHFYYIRKKNRNIQDNGNIANHRQIKVLDDLFNEGFFNLLFTFKGLANIESGLIDIKISLAEIVKNIEIIHKNVQELKEMITPGENTTQHYSIENYFNKKFSNNTNDKCETYIKYIKFFTGEKYQEFISSEEGIGKLVQKMITEQTKFVELSDAFETAFEDMKKVYEWKIVLNEKEVDFFKNWLRVSQNL